MVYLSTIVSRNKKYEKDKNDVSKIENDNATRW